MIAFILEKKYNPSLLSFLIKLNFSKKNCVFLDAEIDLDKLKFELKKIKGLKFICGLGNISLNKFFQTGDIYKMHGSALPYNLGGKSIPYFCLYSFKEIYSSKSKKELNATFLLDLYKILLKSLAPEEIVLPKLSKKNFVQCLNIELVKKMFDDLKGSKEFAFDVETVGLKPFKSEVSEGILYSTSFCIDGKVTYAVPLNKFFPAHVEENILKSIGKIFLEFPKIKKIAHNLKFDISFILEKCIKPFFKDFIVEDVLSNFEDTGFLVWLLDGVAGTSSLKFAVFKYFGVQSYAIDVKDVRKVQLKNLLDYNILDSYYCYELYLFLKLHVEKSDLNFPYKNVLKPSLISFLKIEREGIVVDVGFLNKMEWFYFDKIKTLKEEIRKSLNMPNFNPASHLQLKNIFFSFLKYKPLKMGKTGGSTDKTSLDYFIKNYNCSISKKIQTLRGVETIYSTFVVGLKKQISNDGKLRAGFNLVGTVTGRTSSSAPNMQNIPKRKGKEIRAFFKAPDGYKIVSCDYGQIEARLFAVITGDPAFVDAIKHDYDIHLEMSRWLCIENLGKDEDFAKKMRNDVKQCVFAAFYGAGKNTIADRLKIEENLANKFKEKIFQSFPCVKVWQEEIKKEFDFKGEIDSLFYRKRRAPLSYNELLNFINQSTASDILLVAMNFLQKKYKVVFTIHDDITFLLKEETLEKSVDYILKVMTVLPFIYFGQHRRFREFVPLSVSAEVGKSWDKLELFKSKTSADFGVASLKDIDKVVSKL